MPMEDGASSHCCVGETTVPAGRIECEPKLDEYDALGEAVAGGYTFGPSSKVVVWIYEVYWGACPHRYNGDVIDALEWS